MLQGNVVSPTDDAYTVYGRKRMDRLDGRFNRPASSCRLLDSCHENSEDSGESDTTSGSTSGSPSLPQSRGGESPPDDKVRVVFLLKFFQSINLPL